MAAVELHTGQHTLAVFDTTGLPFDNVYVVVDGREIGSLLFDHDEVTLGQRNNADEWEQCNPVHYHAPRTNPVSINAAVVEALAEVVSLDLEWFRDVAPSLTCTEAEALTGLLVALNPGLKRDEVLEWHARGDDEGDQHHRDELR